MNFLIIKIISKKIICKFFYFTKKFNKLKIKENKNLKNIELKN
jgi:hypothetical protein